MSLSAIPQQKPWLRSIIDNSKLALHVGFLFNTLTQMIWISDTRQENKVRKRFRENEWFGRFPVRTPGKGPGLGQGHWVQSQERWKLLWLCQYHAAWLWAIIFKSPSINFPICKNGGRELSWDWKAPGLRASSRHRESIMVLFPLSLWWVPVFFSAHTPRTLKQLELAYHLEYICHS